MAFSDYTTNALATSAEEGSASQDQPASGYFLLQSRSALQGWSALLRRSLEQLRRPLQDRFIAHGTERRVLSDKTAQKRLLLDQPGDCEADAHETQYSPLLSLPNELIQIIAEATDFQVNKTRDLLCLRVTCRALEFATSHLFLRVYFESTSIVLQRFHLEGYAKLALKADLAQSIRNISISRSRNANCNSVLPNEKFMDSRQVSSHESASKISNVLLKLPNIKSIHFKRCNILSHRPISRCDCFDQYEHFTAVMKAAERCNFQLEE